MGQLRNDKILLGIALVLKELRDLKGVSQEDVYNETNIHIGRIESSNSNLTISTLAELLKYFNIRISDFFVKVESKEKEFTKK
ncbi:MAG: helix-turn-helix transcriptional regulator [Chitinophagaceae bacterium]|nr:helix-turn-helix transcriptional regulator [Chitinophagaceae bacterium]